MNRLLIADPDAGIYAAEIEQQQLADLRIQKAATPEQARRHAGDARIILGRPDHVAPLLPVALQLEWVQSTFAGVETLCAPMLRRDYRLTGVKHVFGPLISEYVMAYVLALERHLFETRDQQKQKRWHNIPYRSLQGLTMGIAGLGSIGRHLAETCARFGMRVLGLKHSAGQVPHVEAVFTMPELGRFLPTLDYLVLALPDTPGTRGLIDADVLKQMKSSAVLINVGRGSSVDQHALASALETGAIGAAVLDVFASEPLPSDDVLWELPNALITPHNAAFSFPRQIAAIFCENYQRFAEGRPLKYTIDFARGY